MLHNTGIKKLKFFVKTENFYQHLYFDEDYVNTLSLRLACLFVMLALLFFKNNFSPLLY